MYKYSDVSLIDVLINVSLDNFVMCEHHGAHLYKPR